MVKSASDAILKGMCSITIRCGKNPEKIGIGPGSKLISGVPMEFFSSIGVFSISQKTFTISGTPENQISAVFRGSHESGPSEYDIARLSERVYLNGWGLAESARRTLINNPKAILPHNEIRFYTSKIEGIITNDQSEIRNDKLIKGFRDYFKEPLTVFFFDTSTGKIYNSRTDKEVVFNPEKVFTRESWEIPCVSDMMKRDFDLAHEEHKKKQDDLKEAKKLLEEQQIKEEKQPRSSITTSEIARLVPYSRSDDYGRGDGQSE